MDPYARSGDAAVGSGVSNAIASRPPPEPPSNFAKMPVQKVETKHGQDTYDQADVPTTTPETASSGDVAVGSGVSNAIASRPPPEPPSNFAKMPVQKVETEYGQDSRGRPWACPITIHSAKTSQSRERRNTATSSSSAAQHWEDPQPPTWDSTSDTRTWEQEYPRSTPADMDSSAWVWDYKLKDWQRVRHHR